MAEFKEKCLYRYEGQDVIVRISYQNNLYKAWFDGNENTFKLGTSPYKAVVKLWNARRKADGKTTQAKYIPPKSRQAKKLKEVLAANDPKPIALIKKKAKAFDKPVKYTVRSLAKYAPARAPQYRRGPPTTPKIT